MKNSRGGFSILELSVVLTVISLIIGSTLAIGATRMQAAKIKDTETKMQAILDTLDSFVQAYGYIPCPADPQAASSSATFGDGTVDASNNCSAANLETSGNVVIGVVPIRTLKMTPAVMMDGWNRRITYAMDTRLNTATKYTATDPDAAGAAYLEVDSTAGNVVTDKAVVVLVSYGPNGDGAWRAKGGSVKVVSDPESTDTDEQANKDGNNVFVQKFPTETFDDVVYYRMKWQFPAVNP